VHYWISTGRINEFSACLTLSLIGCTWSDSSITDSYFAPLMVLYVYVETSGVGRSNSDIGAQTLKLPGFIHLEKFS
jgi:hypothetical protein